MVDPTLSVEPDELNSAAADLDRLADRLERTIGTATVRTTVTAAGCDEVSTSVANSFTSGARAFDDDAATGVLELRKLAATLRLQATRVVDVDDAAAGGLRT